MADGMPDNIHPPPFYARYFSDTTLVGCRRNVFMIMGPVIFCMSCDSPFVSSRYAVVIGAYRAVRLVVYPLLSSRSQLEALMTVADAVGRECDLAMIFFGKWVENHDLDSFYSKLDLLVPPSTWPEPFGLVGLEASPRGVPVAAFAAGGIPNCIRDDKPHSKLCEGGPRIAGSFSAEPYVISLGNVLQMAADSRA